MLIERATYAVSAAFSIEQIQHMLDRQDKLFAHLTQLAVWVQNEVPVSEAAQKRANAARDAARARLAALWTEAAEQG